MIVAGLSGVAVATPSSRHSRQPFPNPSVDACSPLSSSVVGPQASSSPVGMLLDYALEWFIEGHTPLGELTDFLRDTVERVYPILEGQFRVILVHGGDCILPQV